MELVPPIGGGFPLLSSKEVYVGGKTKTPKKRGVKIPPIVGETGTHLWEKFTQEFGPNRSVWDSPPPNNNVRPPRRLSPKERQFSQTQKGAKGNPKKMGGKKKQMTQLVKKIWAKNPGEKYLNWGLPNKTFGRTNNKRCKEWEI